MDRNDVDRWLDAYVAAWKSYDREQIGALFSDDVVYRYHPYDDPVRGRDEVVRSWLGEDEPDRGASTRDPEGTYDATYRDSRRRRRRRGRDRELLLPGHS